MAKSKKNKQYGDRAFGVVVTCSTAVMTHQGLGYLAPNIPAMNDPKLRIAAGGGAVIAGGAAAILPDNEMIRAVGLGVASGGATYGSDQALAMVGLSGPAEDFLEVLNEDFQGMEESSIQGMEDTVVS